MTRMTYVQKHLKIWRRKEYINSKYFHKDAKLSYCCVSLYYNPGGYRTEEAAVGQ